ncbi:MAG TPA: hypothetical protein VIL46_11020, partial [Gemmataceae bacterium]
MYRYAFLTVLFLVLLRLAIGWHFFFEGYPKVRSVYVGETETGRPFTSEGYFREARGPLGEWVRGRLGDPDRQALALLTVRPVAEGRDPAEVAAEQRVPPALAERWDAYYRRFVEHFGLDEPQKKLAEKNFKQAKRDVVEWLTEGTRTVTRSHPKGPEVEVKKRVADLLAEYRSKLGQIEEAYNRANLLFGKNVRAGDLPALKAEARRMREELLAGLDEQTEKMREKLAAVLFAGLPAAAPNLDPQADENKQVLALVTAGQGEEPGPAEDVPAEMAPGALVKRWERHKDAFVRAFPLSEEQKKEAEARLREAKVRYARWLLGRDPVTGTPLPEPEAVGEQVQTYRDLLAAVGKDPGPRQRKEMEEEIGQLRESFLKKATEESERLEKSLAGVLTEGQTTVELPGGEKNAFLEWTDWATRWGVLLMGACLLLG